MYIALDNPAVQFAASALSTSGGHPTTLDEWALKRATRYLHHHPEFEWGARLDREVVVVAVYTDSDWAGDVT